MVGNRGISQGAPFMFFGEYDHTIDDKSRLTLPARFRDALADGVFLTKGLDGCVDVYADGVWEAHIGARLANLDPLLPEARLLSRQFYGSASRDAPDKQGRVHLPQPLLRYADLGKDVTVIGSGDHLEIWDRATWAQKRAEIEGSADNVAQRLAQQHI